MRLSQTLFATWLQAKVGGRQIALVIPARQPDKPDRCVTVLRVGGGKDLYDGAFEEVPFRLQTRGRTERLDDAEQLALLIDNILFDINNELIGGVYVTTSRVVNKPKQMPITDKQSRYQFSADYLLLASRTN